MLLEGDFAQLEWRCAAFLSQDRVMMDEIEGGVDAHNYTLQHFFGGKGERVAAKVFNFGMIYGRTKYGYFYDATMPKFSLKEWDKIIDQFYAKYTGLHKWHQDNIKLVNKQGFLVNPTGRILKFPLVEQRDGSRCYHEPHIKNYPVQSFATADLVPLAAVQIRKRVRLEKLRAKLIQIVHDSFLYDVHSDDVTKLAGIINHYVRKLHETVQQWWGFTLNVPMDSEIKVGRSWGEMKVIV